MDIHIDDDRRAIRAVDRVKIDLDNGSSVVIRSDGAIELQAAHMSHRLSATADEIADALFTATTRR